MPISWRAYDQSLLKGRMRRYEMAVIRRVLTRRRQAIGRRRLIVTANRGFADVELARLLQSFGVQFIIRVKHSTKVCVNGQWQRLSRIRFEGHARHRRLGRIAYCERSPERLWVTMS